MKKTKRNFKWIIAVILVTIVAVVMLVAGVNIYKIYRLPENHVEITGMVVNNHYNNFISESDPVNPTGDLVRIGDKLYYNYYGTYASYGLYEISSNGAQRIYWDGYGPWAFLSGHEIKLYPIQAYRGSLLMNTITDGNYYVYNQETKEWEIQQGCIQSYREEYHAFEKESLFAGDSHIHGLTYQETSFGLVYESSERFDLWVYTEKGGSQRIAATDVCSFYTVGERIYYLTLTSPNAPHVLRVFDWSTKTDTVICELDAYSDMSHFIIEEDTLIFAADQPDKSTQSVYKLDLNDPNQAVEAIYTIGKSDSNVAYIYNWNTWNGTVYICTSEGLISCDLASGTHSLLCDKNILECDILDDTWVYFIESKTHSLWRVRQSGGDAELVLG